MSKAIRLQGEEVRYLAFGSITGTYTGIGTEMIKPIRMLIFQNLTDVAVMLSLDGIVDWMPLAANGYIILDITSNKTIDTGFFMGEGQRLYVRHIGVAPSAYGVYVSTIYGAE